MKRPETNKPASKTSPRCILLAESNALLRETMVAILSRSDPPWSLIQATGREELLRMAARAKPDVILAGISLINDPKTVAVLRKSLHSCRIIAMTEAVSEPYQHAAQQLGLDGIINKKELVEFLSTGLENCP